MASGAAGNKSDDVLDGRLDDVRIYNRVLSADEIKRLYNLGGTVKLNTSQNLNNNNSLQNGLVGWWTFDGKEMAGNYAFDKSGNGNRGTLTNGPERAIGKIGQAIDFHSSNSQVNAGSAAVLDNMTVLSFVAWIYPRSLGGGSRGTLFDKESTGGVTSRFEPNANLAFITGHATNLEAYSAYNVINLNKWQHVAVIWDGSLTAAKVQFYLNGAPLAHQASDEVNGSGSNATDAAGDFLLGFQVGNTRQFDGLMDDARLYVIVHLGGRVRQQGTKAAGGP